MPRKLRNDLVMTCEECGHKPEGEVHGTFLITSTTCPLCGGTVSLMLDNESGGLEDATDTERST